VRYKKKTATKALPLSDTKCDSSECDFHIPMTSFAQAQTDDPSTAEVANSVAFKDAANVNRSPYPPLPNLPAAIWATKVTK